MHRLLLTCLLLTLTASCEAPSLRERLEGTWTDNQVAVTINLDDSTLTAAGIGFRRTGPVRIARETPEYVLLELVDERATVQFLDDDRILFTWEHDEARPRVLTRLPE